MHIFIKVIDTFKSTTHKNKVVPEFIIYLMMGEIPIMAFTELGHSYMRSRLEEVKYLYNITDVYFEIKNHE